MTTITFLWRNPDKNCPILKPKCNLNLIGNQSFLQEFYEITYVFKKTYKISYIISICYLGIRDFFLLNLKVRGNKFDLQNQP